MKRPLSLLALSMISAMFAVAACGSDDPARTSPSALGGATSDAADGAEEGEEPGDAARDAAKKDSGKKDGASGDAADGAEEDAEAPSDAAPADAGPEAPTFTEVYTTVISGTCTGCHGNTHVAGLAMKTKALAYANLVGKKAGTGGAGACNDGTRTRVVAGDAASSLLFKKISHTNDCGSGMPLGGAKLAQSKIDLVEAWINAGAAND